MTGKSEKKKPRIAGERPGQFLKDLEFDALLNLMHC